MKQPRWAWPPFEDFRVIQEGSNPDRFIVPFSDQGLAECLMGLERASSPTGVETKIWEGTPDIFCLVCLGGLEFLFYFAFDRTNVRRGPEPKG